MDEPCLEVEESAVICETLKVNNTHKDGGSVFLFESFFIVNKF